MLHEDFVNGIGQNSIEIKYRLDIDPGYIIITRSYKVFTAILVGLYLFVPFIAVPAYAYYMGNWWLLLGILFELLSFQGPYILLLTFGMFCSSWYTSGLSFYTYGTFFFMCSLWGRWWFEATNVYNDHFAIRDLIAYSELYNKAIDNGFITVHPKN